MHSTVEGQTPEENAQRLPTATPPGTVRSSRAERPQFERGWSRAQGCCGASVPILSLRRVGRSVAEQGHCGGEGRSGESMQPNGGRLHTAERRSAEAANREPAASADGAPERVLQSRGMRRRQEPRRSERQQARRTKVSLPGRASDHLSGLEGNLPEMSSAGADGKLNLRRNGAGAAQPDAQAVRGGGRLTGRERHGLSGGRRTERAQGICFHGAQRNGNRFPE